MVVYVMTGVGFILLIILLLFKPKQEEIVCNNQIRDYEDANYPVKIQYPSCWLVNTTPGITTFAQIYPADDNNKIKIIFDLEKHTGNLDNYEKTLREFNNRNLRGATYVSSENITIAQRNGRKVIFTATKELEDKNKQKKKIKIKNQYLFTIRGTKLYLITYSANIEDYDKYLPVVNKIIQSLEIDDQN